MHPTCKHLATLAVSILLLNCAANTEQPEQALPIQQETDKAETLSNFKTTTIETSNGTITVEPTVVSSTDRTASIQHDELLEITQSEYSDPLEFINRPIFTFNHYTYKYALAPLARGYKAILPQPVRTSVANAFDNIREPLNLINNSLSGEFSEAANNLGRFAINSTIGLLGLFDPASSWFGIDKKPQNVSQTLTKYNIGSGAYIVLPILGQSDIRGTFSIISEGLVHPINYALDTPSNNYARALDGFDDFSIQADTYMTLFESSEDPYIYFRNQYIQSTNRDEMVADKANSEVNIGGAGRDE